MRIRQTFLTLAALLPVLAYGCAAPSGDDDGVAGEEDAYTSASAKLLDFEFDGEVTMAGGSADQTIRDQMLFTIGQLNGRTGVGRLDKLALTNVTSEAQGGLTRVRYHAKLPVSIAKSAKVSRTFTLVLPKRADFAGQDAFFNKYGATSCADPFAHDNETGIYWYYYRPDQAGCTLAAEDVIKVKAKVRVSPENTKNTYPEYDKIWSDDVLSVVAIFGKVEDGATTDADRGIWSHGHFVSTLRNELPNAAVTPAATPDSPGIANPDVTIESTLANGKKVKITSFLVDNVREGGAAFEARYNALSGDADVIVYNGHAGLGQNVRALAKMGTFKPGKYQIVYMNGCDTFAYVDGTLAQTRARLNPSDPTGTKFMEILTNSMPPNWDSLPNNTISLVRDLLKVTAPVKYTDILAHFDQSGFVTVTGDEDNTFKP
ncbi:MAG TPA: hypothetical protein VLT33_39615 [Labilithrix sp.]|nr:hypothetical protein [Labilithrix sp.]